ncbi:hypothetical protein AVEN_247134-1, partial [Araneus ventricosus]
KLRIVNRPAEIHGGCRRDVRLGEGRGIAWGWTFRMWGEKERNHLGCGRCRSQCLARGARALSSMGTEGSDNAVAALTFPGLEK